MPGIYVGFLPGHRRKFAARFGEHLGRGIDPDYFGARKSVRKDAGEMAGAAAEIINRGIVRFRDARNQVQTRAEADFGIAKVSLRLPDRHGWRKSYHRANLRGTRLDEKTLHAIELHELQTVFGAHLVLHAIKMILDGLFRQGEMVGDFLVGQALADDRHALLLAAALAQAPAGAATGKGRP